MMGAEIQHTIYLYVVLPFYHGTEYRARAGAGSVYVKRRYAAPMYIHS